MLDPLAPSVPETPPKTNGATVAADADADEAGWDIIMYKMYPVINQQMPQQPGCNS